MPDHLDGKRLLIVEEALKDFVGHWYEYVKSVAELVCARGGEVTVLGHTGAGPGLQAELNLRPVFDKSPWDGAYRNGPLLLRKLGLLRHNAWVFRKVRSFLEANDGFDCTFAPTVVGHHIWAWRLLTLLYSRRLGRVVLLIRNNVATYRQGSNVPQFDFRARLFGLALRSFAGAVRSGRVVFATDSERLAEEYRQLCGVVPVVFPSPRIAAPAARPEEPSERTGLTFACLGPARFEKGIDILQAAMGKFLSDESNPTVNFIVQWPNAIEDGAGRPYLPDPQLAASERVRFLTEPLDSGAYDDLLAATDCMVLPYRRSSYFARISGVAVEAVTAGIPVIATEDTWTGELVSDCGAGILIPDGDVAALARAISSLAGNHTEFRRAAEARKGKALARHSGEAFLNALWGRRGSPTA